MQTLLDVSKGLHLFNSIQPAPKQLHKRFHYTALYTIPPNNLNINYLARLGPFLLTSGFTIQHSTPYLQNQCQGFSSHLHCSTVSSPYVQRFYSEDAKLAKVFCPCTIMLAHIFLYNGPFAQPHSTVMDAQVFTVQGTTYYYCFLLCPFYEYSCC